METVVLWVLGILAVGIALVWLVILPFRLTRGLLHKWGYHAHCGVNCEDFVRGQNLRAHLNSQYSAGLRQGTRMALQMGGEEATKMLKDASLFAELESVHLTDDRSKRVGYMCNQAVRATDVNDDIQEWQDALAAALSLAVRRDDDPHAALERSIRTLTFLSTPDESPSGIPA